MQLWGRIYDLAAFAQLPLGYVYRVERTPGDTFAGKTAVNISS